MVKNILIISISFLLNGCAGFGVFEPSDPMDKLYQACSVLIDSERHFPARRLLGQAIKKCKKTNDTPCLAQAYITSGVFHRAMDRFPHLEKRYSDWLMGNKESLIEYQNRDKLAKDFFEKAEVLANDDEKLLKKIELARETSLDNFGMEYHKFCY